MLLPPSVTTLFHVRGVEAPQNWTTQPFEADHTIFVMDYRNFSTQKSLAREWQLTARYKQCNFIRRFISIRSVWHGRPTQQQSGKHWRRTALHRKLDWLLWQLENWFKMNCYVEVLRISLKRRPRQWWKQSLKSNVSYLSLEFQLLEHQSKNLWLNWKVRNMLGHNTR